MSVRFQIDGVWHDVDARERESGDMLLAVMKTLAGLDANQRVARQDGTFGAEFEKNKYTCRLVSQGTKTGERALLQFQRGKNKIEKLADLEMRAKLVEDSAGPTLRAKRLDRRFGPAGRRLVDAVYDHGRGDGSLCPQLCRDRVDRESRNSTSKTFRSRVSTREPAKPRDDPAETDSRASGRLHRARHGRRRKRQLRLFEQVEHENRQVVTSVRAKEAAESLLRVMMLKMPADKFANSVTMALNQRMIRKLCNKCKEAYAPAPQVLEQLGIPAGRVEAFYRVPQPSPEKEEEEAPAKSARGSATLAAPRCTSC